MNIGVISDTHGLVRKEVFDALDGVEMILHAGDIGGWDVLAELGAIAPVHAVAGNNDADLFGRISEEIKLEIQGRKIEIRHFLDKSLPESTPADGDVRKIVVFGHLHKPVNQQIGKTLYFNPGSAGPRRRQLPVTLGRLTFTPDRVESQIIFLE